MKAGLEGLNALIIVVLLMISPLSSATTLYMAGDSTMSIKAPSDHPETGWGEPFAHFFGEQLEVINLAKNGRSTKTFISEGWWQQIKSNIQPGDFLIIQFGHNDQSKSKTKSYTTAQEYTANIITMLEFALAKHAKVILMTPLTRRIFDNQGKLTRTHPYADLVRQIARDHEGVTLIDMEEMSHAYIKQLGQEASRLRFMHIAPNLHPNYPNGIKDNTHLNELGAREFAQLVLAELRQQNHPMTHYIRRPDPSHLHFSY